MNLPDPKSNVADEGIKEGFNVLDFVFDDK